MRKVLPLRKRFEVFILPVILFLFIFSPLYGKNEVNDLIFTLEKEETEILPFQNISYHPLKKLKVALVLSGGGARGLSHIGVLKAFEEHQMPINLIVGTSIGSIVGGFYAAGFSADEIREIVIHTDLNSVFDDEAHRTHLFLSQKSIPRRHLLQFRLDGVVPVIPSSITHGQKIFQTFYNQLIKASFQARNDFNNLKIPFRSVATNLISGEKVVLDHGDLAEAMNASMAFPLLFAPVEIDGILLVDGGMSDNLPVEVAIREGADVTIAVDATSPLRKKDEINAPWEVADQVTTIMMQTPTAESRRKADMVLQPSLENFKGGDFEDADSVIQAGYQIVLENLDSLGTLIRKARNKKKGEDTCLGRAVAVNLTGISEDTFNEIQHHLKLLPSRLPLIKTISSDGSSGIPVFRNDIMEDLREIYESGYFEDVMAIVQGDTNQRMITYHVKEQPFIDSVFIYHSHVLPDSTIQEAIHTIQNKRLNMNILYEQLYNLRNELIKQGHSLAEVKQVHYQPKDHSLHIYIDEGFIHKIKLSGNEKTKDFVITRELPLKAGNLFQAVQASEGINNIYSTNLFDRVLINLEKEQDQNTLVVKVKEKKYFLARLGAHYSLEREAEGFLEFLEDNFLGTATKVSLFGLVGDFSKRAEALFYSVRLFKTYLTASAKWYYDEREDKYYTDFIKTADYQTIRNGIRLEVGQQIQRLGLISAELNLEEVELLSTIPGLPGQRYKLRTFSIRSVVDKRDKLPFPDHGIYNRWYWETGSQQILGGNVSFTKIFLGLEGYYPFAKRFNLHPYIYGGSADLTLPFSEFFFFGGQKNFPGLYEKEIFGRQYIHGGADIRYRLEWKLPAEVFVMLNYSVGAAWERPDDRINRSDFLHSVSASIAINSLLGPVQFTYAKLFEQREALYFSIGFDF